MPKGKAENEDLIQQGDPELGAQNEKMTTDLNDIYNIIYQKPKSVFQAQGNVISLNWYIKLKEH